jgi:hypothetical protein
MADVRHRCVNRAIGNDESQGDAATVRILCNAPFCAGFGSRNRRPEGQQTAKSARFALPAAPLRPETFPISSFISKMTLLPTHRHIIIINARPFGASLLPKCNLSIRIDFCQVVHRCLAGAPMSRRCFIRPATTINRLYFNHD